MVIVPSFRRAEIAMRSSLCRPLGQMNAHRLSLCSGCEGNFSLDGGFSIFSFGCVTVLFGGGGGGEIFSFGCVTVVVSAGGDIDTQ